MSIIFQNGGILTTVQDLGRTGFQQLGINPNGAMDARAARLINILLGNDETESILEMHFPAAKILFTQDAVIALGGADFDAQIGMRKIANWRPIFVSANSVLNFTQKKFGNRLYLAVKGGFKIESWLGSTSTNLKAKIGGFNGRNLKNGDEILLKNALTSDANLNFQISKKLLPIYSALPTVRVVKGAEFEKLTDQSKGIFQTKNYRVRRQSDRMGFHLEGENLKLEKPLEMLSSAVDFGTIQLLPDGQMIILMADHQTTGGYPRIANVINYDLPLIAQLGANDRLNFKIVSISEAENLTAELEKDLNLLKTACRFQY